MYGCGQQARRHGRCCENSYVMQRPASDHRMRLDVLCKSLRLQEWRRPEKVRSIHLPASPAPSLSLATRTCVTTPESHGSQSWRHHVRGHEVPYKTDRGSPARKRRLLPLVVHLRAKPRTNKPRIKTTKPVNPTPAQGKLDIRHHLMMPPPLRRGVTPVHTMERPHGARMPAYTHDDPSR